MNKLFLDWRSKLRAAPETPAKSATGRYWLDRAGHRTIDANLARWSRAWQGSSGLSYVGKRQIRDIRRFPATDKFLPLTVSQLAEMPQPNQPFRPASEGLQCDDYFDDRSTA